MHKTTYLLLSITLTLVLLGSCKKKEEPTDDPVISLITVSDTEIQQFTETLVVSIEYSDINGDIGTMDPDSVSLFVQDSRLDEPDGYHIPPLAPLDATIQITGRIDVSLNSPFLLGNGGDENVVFAITLRDRHGHRSNEILTPTITIKK